MTFGQQLKELRLKYADKGLRRFADEIGMSPSGYGDIERGFVPPPTDIEWFWKIVYALGLGGDITIQVKLATAIREPFVMQKMAENVIPAFVCSSDGKPIAENVFRELTEWLNDKAVEHNRKADEYNGSRQ